MEQYPQGKKEKWPEQVAFLINEAESGNEEAIYSLLNWLKDMNWPGAIQACDYLIANMEKILPRIMEVFHGEDYQWKYWVINSLVAKMPKEMLHQLTPELVGLTEYNDGEKVNLSSALILCKEHLCSKNEMIEIVKRIEQFNPDSSEEVDEIKGCIG